MKTYTDPILVSTHRISKWYGNKLALSDVSITLERNKIYGFIGRNGSGKSTLISLISGVIQPDVGTVNRAPELTIAKVTCDLDFPGFLPLYKIDSLFRASSNEQWDSERYFAVLEIFSLSPKSKFSSLSTGEKAGVKLAVLIAQKADLWLLDEATLGLDILAQHNCLTAILSYFVDDQPCIIFCSHHLSEIERLADDVVIMESGEIIWNGPREALKEDNTSFSDTIFNRFKGLRENAA